MSFARLPNYLQSFVFAYIGISVFAMKGSDLNVLFVFLAFMFCLVGRAMNTFPLTAGLNYLRKRKVDFKTQFVIWFSGLRGAIAFALALDVDTENKNIIKTTTLAIVLITTFLIGGATLPILEALKIVGGEETAAREEAKREREAVTRSKMWFLRYDRKYFTPFFCKTDYLPEERVRVRIHTAYKVGRDLDENGRPLDDILKVEGPGGLSDDTDNKKTKGKADGEGSVEMELTPPPAVAGDDEDESEHDVEKANGGKAGEKKQGGSNGGDGKDAEEEASVTIPLD